MGKKRYQYIWPESSKYILGIQHFNFSQIGKAWDYLLRRDTIVVLSKGRFGAVSIENDFLIFQILDLHRNSAVSYRNP